jgi:hypothetical protein
VELVVAAPFVPPRHRDTQGGLVSSPPGSAGGGRGPALADTGDSARRALLAASLAAAGAGLAAASRRLPAGDDG